MHAAGDACPIAGQGIYSSNVLAKKKKGRLLYSVSARPDDQAGEAAGCHCLCYPPFLGGVPGVCGGKRCSWSNACGSLRTQHVTDTLMLAVLPLHSDEGARYSPLRYCRAQSSGGGCDPSPSTPHSPVSPLLGIWSRTASRLPSCAARNCVFEAGLASQVGFATFLGSLAPVSGSLYSFQLTGTMSLPASLVAMMTPSSLDAVER